MSANKSLTSINTKVSIPRRSRNSSNFGNFSKSHKSINLTYLHMNQGMARVGQTEDENMTSFVKSICRY